MTDVVIPIKRLAQAKGRLGHVLSPDERAGLVLAMLRDVLTTLRLANVDDIWLVASDDAVFEVGASFDARSLRETPPTGYNAAVSLGLSEIPGTTPVLVLPGDVPLVRPDDIAAITEASGDIRIVADHTKQGTNGLFLSSPNLIKPMFGPNSLQNHKAAAEQAGLQTRQLMLPNLAQDIDTTADLAHPGRATFNGATTEFLQSIQMEAAV